VPLLLRHQSTTSTIAIATRVQFSATLPSAAVEEDGLKRGTGVVIRQTYLPARQLQ